MESLRKPHARDLSLDLLKACSMLLVVFFHNGQLRPGSFFDNLFMLIPMAAVPCFFMVSGAVFFHRPLDIKKHVRRMLVFYLTLVLWKAVYLMLYHYWGTPLNGSLRTMFSYLFLFQHLDGVGTAHFWFMDAMLTVMFAAPLLHVCFHQKNKELLLFLLGILFLFNQLTASGNLVISSLCHLIGKPAWDIAPLAEVSPFSFRYSNYFTYYLLGGLLMEYRQRISMRTAVLLSGIGITGLLMIQYIQTGSFVWQGILISGGYYWISTMLLAAGGFLLFIRIPVAQSRILSWIAGYVGSATLWIFYLHIPLIFLLTPGLFTQLSRWNGWLLNLAESCMIAGIAVCVCLAYRNIHSIVRKSGHA